MRLGIIIANAPHLKTEQVSLNLFYRGGYDITYLALPFILRPTRNVIFQHRPTQSNSAPLPDVARRLGFRFTALQSLEEVDASGFDYFLLTGGTLIPDAFVEAANKRIINCHPGLIPTTRGLDAFKWAILDGSPVGNTLHAIDGEIDGGTVFQRVETPVFRSDTIKQFALRHYEREISLLSDFERYISGEPIEYEIDPSKRSRMRMSAEKERDLAAAFDRYKEVYG